VRREVYSFKICNFFDISILKKFMIEKLLKDRSDNIFIQLFRYTFVGGVSFIVDFGTLFIFTEFLKIYYLVSAMLSFLLGLITNYILSINWVFNKRAFKNKWSEFEIFAVIGIVGLGLNELFIYFFTEQVHFYYLLSKIFSTIIVYIWNFFSRKYILFY